MQSPVSSLGGEGSDPTDLLPPARPHPPFLQTHSVTTIIPGAASNKHYQFLTGDEAAKADPDKTALGQTEAHKP